jgi:CheY-like chemotaxis protein
MTEQRKRILVVDDDEAVREVIQTVLEQAGYVVTAAWDGRTAYDALGQADCDAIVLDCLLPGNVASAIAGEAARLEIPVLLTSGHPDQITHQGADGAPMFIAKPFRVAKLLAALAALIPGELTK